MSVPCGSHALQISGLYLLLDSAAASKEVDTDMFRIYLAVNYLVVSQFMTPKDRELPSKVSS